MTQILPGTYLKFYLLFVVVECVAATKSNTSAISQSLPATFLHQLLKPFPSDCHVILQGSFGGDILEILQRQRPLLLLENNDGLDIDSGIYSHYVM